MHIAILGAGVVGMTTTYYLTGFGHTVSGFDCESRVGEGASSGNAAQLAYSNGGEHHSPPLFRSR